MFPMKLALHKRNLRSNGFQSRTNFIIASRRLRTIFIYNWVRKLIGKLGVPYNRRLRVRGSPHPLFYDADLSLPAADSNAFRIHLDLPCPDRLKPEELFTILELPLVT